MRRAFTLMELLLVLALLVAIIAVAAPTIGRFSQTQQLRDAAQIVRGEWARARVQSMKSGRIHVFRYEPNGSRYAVDFWIADNDAVESGDDDALAKADDGVTEPGTDFDLEMSGKSLPDGIRFFIGQTMEDARDASVQADLQFATGGSSPISPPVLFYSEGTSSTSQVILVNERGRAISISLRGLTGVARVGEVYALEGSAP